MFKEDAWKHLYDIEICTPAKELTMSLDKYAHLNKCKIWRRNWNKRKYVPRIQLSFSKNEHQNEVVWLIHLKGAVKYQCSDFPRHATLDVPRPWFVLTRRKRRVRNTTLYDTSRFLTRRVPIQDSPSAVENHGPVNSTKLLISRSVPYRIFNGTWTVLGILLSDVSQNER